MLLLLARVCDLFVLLLRVVRVVVLLFVFVRVFVDASLLSLLCGCVCSA